MTDEAMTAVRRVEAYLAYRQASEDDGCVDVLSEADLTYGDLRTLLTLARQSVGAEEIVRNAYEEGVEDGIGWHCYPESGPRPEWIDSVARVNVLTPRSVRTADLTEEEVVGEGKP